MKSIIILLLSAHFATFIKALPITDLEPQDSLDSLLEFAFDEATPLWMNSKRDVSLQRIDYNKKDLDDFIFPAEDDDTPITDTSCAKEPTKRLPETNLEKENVADNGLQAKIRGYISDWLDSASMQITKEKVNGYVNNIYEIIYGPAPTEAELVSRRELDFEDAHRALGKLRKAVVDILNGYIYQPNVRNNLRALADILISKVAVLNLRSCPQTPEQRHMIAELKEVNILLKRAIRKLNDALLTK